ncbi:ADP-ribosylation factor-like protein 6-interacting protein 4 [Cloeon dipterum]|uniref:ADP-ribosylation factor-like protein 6-interacting protein 4 n=1 Tax=Cloeon dipterum TaxID=197152 RepID=UPI0032209F93
MSKSKKQKKEKKHKEKKERRKKHKKHSRSKSPPMIGPSLPTEIGPSVGPLPPAVPTSSMVPMTKEQWEAKQSQIRRVLDPETGRMRLIRGEGEIIEEPVSRSRQKEINKLATQNDGEAFQKTLAAKLKVKVSCHKLKRY